MFQRGAAEQRGGHPARWYRRSADRSTWRDSVAFVRHCCAVGWQVGQGAPQWLSMKIRTPVSTLHVHSREIATGGRAVSILQSTDGGHRSVRFAHLNLTMAR